MDIDFDGLKFEWDPAKNAINKFKHQVDFNDVLKLFFDENRLTRRDDRYYYGETRFQVIGQNGFKILFVVYAEKKEDHIRIISARKADKREKDLYHKGYFDWD